jgi:hypothetical protein
MLKKYGIKVKNSDGKLKKYEGGILVIKQYPFDMKNIGGYIKVYVLKPFPGAGMEFSRYLDENYKLRETDMIDITEKISDLFAFIDKPTKDGKLWYPGIAYNREEEIVRHIKIESNVLFNSLFISVNESNSVIYLR